MLTVVVTLSLSILFLPPIESASLSLSHIQRESAFIAASSLVLGLPVCLLVSLSLYLAQPLFACVSLFLSVLFGHLTRSHPLRPPPPPPLILLSRKGLAVIRPLSLSPSLMLLLFPQACSPSFRVHVCLSVPLSPSISPVHPLLLPGSRLWCD